MSRRADAANFVGCRGGTRAIPLLVVPHIHVAYVRAMGDVVIKIYEVFVTFELYEKTY